MTSENRETLHSGARIGLVKEKLRKRNCNLRENFEYFEEISDNKILSLAKTSPKSDTLPLFEPHQ
jgi:hypothetical protein